MGLVSRTRSSTSNREVVVELTPKAATLVARLIPIAEDLQETATRGLSKQDLAVVKRALRRMHENLVRDGAVEPSHRPIGATKKALELEQSPPSGPAKLVYSGWMPAARTMSAHFRVSAAT